ncbi:hypothetical protein CSB45_06685 [candidate division KSB3 bacterium]|uniref:LysM domain-containing protein n=1 Tax=candidate division KSB3 bacterium TaxID=2044937 RepID=A0A2G6E5Z8_9BACT|nr:MAG: hypothetical protein CSB45_06685 [candidate division KSB3 bacterium]PIE30079.1 MAG: hypothetical protein CSA57_05910 [candidate division KSB3 bacterium]
MKPLKRVFIHLFACMLLGVLPCDCPAQDDGFLNRLSGENGGLPAGARYENGLVLHPVSSAEENLHLLAGYYFGNPRKWKRIYNDNRSVISNPNRLPVGQTLTIHVGKNWKPLFSYEEWFRAANRNGQWKPGQSWKAVRNASEAQSGPSDALAQTTEKLSTPPSTNPDTGQPQIRKNKETPASSAKNAQGVHQQKANVEPPSPAAASEPEMAEDDEDRAPAF